MPQVIFYPPPTATGVVFVKTIADNGSAYRTSIVPGYMADASTFVPTDTSGLPAEVQSKCAEVWTADVVAAFKAANPYIAPNAAQLRLQAFQSDSNRQAILAAISNATPAQVATYVNNQVTDLASAKAMLVKVVLLLATVAS